MDTPTQFTLTIPFGLKLESEQGVELEVKPTEIVIRRLSATEADDMVTDTFQTILPMAVRWIQNYNVVTGELQSPKTP
jgi:hypothetical protein